MNSNQLNEDRLLSIAWKFNIDTKRYTPVKIESTPFVALFCIDSVESETEGREWITKFDILTANVEQLKHELGTENLEFAVNEKYSKLVHDEGNTIDYPDSGD